MKSWSPQQEHALRECRRWLSNPSGSQVFYLAGFAGTGKTTLAKELTLSAHGRWLFAAFTGKAAHVLRQKGCDASTIHSLIYRPNGESKDAELRTIEIKIDMIASAAGKRYPDAMTKEEEKEIERLLKLRSQLNSENKPRFALWSESPLADLNVEGIVIDECSMVDEYLGKDLLSFEKKVLVLGDPFQLPPVGAGGYFTNRTPDIMLTEVHRHAKDSGILMLATKIREGWNISNLVQEGWKDVDLRFRADIDRQELWMAMMATDQVLVGKNDTRHRTNSKFRSMIGKTDPGPMTDDRLVCLKNRHSEGLFNGSQWKVVAAENDLEGRTSDLRLKSEDDISGELCTSAWLHHMVGEAEELKEMGPARQSFSEFDWSYALTVHKAQGSQWDDVILIDESTVFRGTSKKWLYTGITRAAKRLMVVI
jgi:ATP-dependent exoDNAse (exonuclease V) alpha subunit